MLQPAAPRQQDKGRHRYPTATHARPTGSWKRASRPEVCPAARPPSSPRSSRTPGGASPLRALVLRPRWSLQPQGQMQSTIRLSDRDLGSLSFDSRLGLTHEGRNLKMRRDSPGNPVSKDLWRKHENRCAGDHPINRSRFRPRSKPAGDPLFSDSATRPR